MAGASRKSLLRYTKNMVKASEEIRLLQGLVTQKLSSVIFVASFLQNFDERVLVESSAASSTANDNLDEISNLMIDAWATVERKALINPTFTRRISMEKTGTVAIALVIESDIRNEALPLVLGGAQSLALTRPSITFIMVPHFVPSTTIPGLTDSLSIPPQTGITTSRVPLVHITAWPSATPFNDQLFCFYQGFDGNARRLFYNVYDGNTWLGEKQVPNPMITEGPSAVVFNNKLYCFKRGNPIDAEIWYNVFDGVNWKDDEVVTGARLIGGPSAVVFNDKIYCFHQGFNDHRIWYNVFDGIKWEGNQSLSTTSHITGSPSAVLFNDLIHVFYQGFGMTENHVMMEIVLNPSTGGVDRDARHVPNVQRMSESPSAVVVDGKLYLFHQDESGGNLYVTVSGDGDQWAEDTLVEDVNLTMGLASTSFNNELYFFFQRGELGKVTDGELWYRKLELARGGTIGGEGAQGDPSLEQLGYSEGYEGYRDLADKIRDSHKAESGYVVYITKLPLLFNVYADETRMCMQYTDPSFIHLHFPTMFSAEGTFDQRIVGNATGYPPRLDTRRDPRYTFAWVTDWNNVFTAANMLLFHRGQGNDRNTHLWVVFLDKRNSRWIEMQGPEMSANTSIRIGAPTPVFASSSRLLYVFYNNNSEILCYNALATDATGDHTDILWGVEKVASHVRFRNTPSPISVTQNLIRLYVEAQNSRIAFTSLDTQTNHWSDVTEASQINGNSSPSAVHYLEKIYVFYRGSSGIYFNKLAYSIWEKEEDNTWTIGTSIESSPYGVDPEPSAVVYKDVVYCFYTYNNHLWYSIFNGRDWARATQVNMVHNQSRPMAGGVSTFVWQDKIHCFFRLDLSVARPLLYYKVFDITQNVWSEEVILPTASGLSSKPSAILNQLLMGS